MDTLQPTMDVAFHRLVPSDLQDLAAVASEIAAPAVGKPVVDVSNRIGFGADGPEIDTSSSNAEALAGVLRGFRDGVPGLIYALLMALHPFLARAKRWERQRRS